MNRLIAVSIAALLLLSACAGLPRLGQPTPQPPASLAPTFTPATPAPEAEAQWIALIGLDGNVWLVDDTGSERRPVTQDGTPFAEVGSANPWIEYHDLSWSADGRLLAFRSLTRLTNATGMEFSSAIWVYDFELGETRLALENVNPSGLAFRPGTHLLAYDATLDPAYFVNGVPDANQARGIMGLDLDTGETAELVHPEHGLWLSEPRWSPDGNTLGFTELLSYEDAAPFGLYDFENQVYGAWNQVIGSFDFAPNGGQIAYDRLAYNYSADNQRIWISDLWGKGEFVFSPANGPVAHGPAWSPQGDQVAFALGDPAATYQQNPPNEAGNELVVQFTTGGETLRLGSYSYIGPLAWSPDGTRLAFATGPYDYRSLQPLIEPLVKVVSVTDGAVIDLAYGLDPAWRPVGGQ